MQGFVDSVMAIVEAGNVAEVADSEHCLLYYKGSGIQVIFIG